METQLTETEQNTRLSMAEAAHWMKVQPDSMRNIIKLYAPKLPEYISKQIHTCSISGKTRRMTVITKQGLVVLVNMKDSNRGNQFEKNDAKPRFLEAKKEIAETAIQAVSPQPSHPSSLQVLLQTVQEMANLETRMNEKFDNMEKKIEEVTVALTAPIPSSTGMRDELNDRVKAYVAKMKKIHGVDIPYYRVWEMIHAHVQAYAVANFTFKHYIAALKYLKQVYKDSNLLY